MTDLEARDISKYFGGVCAVDGASFSASGGEVHALVGENGAGKSTLLKIVSGLVRADAGSIRLGGQSVDIKGAGVAQKLGVGTVFQELTLLSHMSVAENLLLRREPRGRFGLVRRRELGRQAEALMQQLGLPPIDPHMLVGVLPLARQQLIEIAKVIVRKPDVLLFDEATSALGEKDVEWLFALIRRLRAEGRTIVFTSHRWKEVASISDRMTIFRNGRDVASGTLAEIDENRAVELMTGRSIGAAFPTLPTRQVTKPLLRVELLLAGQVKDVSFSLHAGEILGVGGLSGQGQGDLFQALFGAHQMRAGSLFVEERRVRLRSPRDAIAKGIALVPEDRKGEGLFLPMSIRHNMSLPILGRLSRFGYIDRRSERERVQGVIDQLAVRTTGERQAVGALSGGNQQKVLIGRWLLTGAKILLLYDVTRGVDVATKHDIYGLIGKLSAAGTGILLYSSDTEEMAHLCHRVLVMREGRIAAELVEGRISSDILVRTALHVDAPSASVPMRDVAQAAANIP